MYTINLGFFDAIFDTFNVVVDYLDAISFGGLFTLLDLSLGVIVVSAFFPLVLSLRNGMSTKGSKD